MRARVALAPLALAGTPGVLPVTGHWQGTAMEASALALHLLQLHANALIMMHRKNS